MKIWNNYKTILSKAEEISSLKHEVKEIKEHIIQGHNVKTAIYELKEKVEYIINQKEYGRIWTY